MQRAEREYFQEIFPGAREVGSARTRRFSNAQSREPDADMGTLSAIAGSSVGQTSMEMMNV
jgi:hypothetical protein